MIKQRLITNSPDRTIYISDFKLPSYSLDHPWVKPKPTATRSECYVRYLRNRFQFQKIPQRLIIIYVYQNGLYLIHLIFYDWYGYKMLKKKFNFNKFTFINLIRRWCVEGINLNDSSVSVHFESNVFLLSPNLALILLLSTSIHCGVHAKAKVH